MEQYVVSARKYRPKHFSDVVGQEHVTQTLKNAIKRQKIAQAFLFCGPRGVGKTTCARILAKTINCENLQDNQEACGECPSCISFQEQTSFNIHELDAASNNSVEDIRALAEQVRYAPQSGKYKIYIIDEVHMLSSSAFNAFLKTLEEPPPYAIFILATTEKHKILPTILSRCQIFDFNRISVKAIVKHLQEIAQQEGVKVESDALHLIAQKADGALRDALSIFDRLLSFADHELTYESVLDNLNILDYDYYFKITDALLSEDQTSLLLMFDEIQQKGFEGDTFLGGLSQHFRDLLMCRNEETLPLLEVSEGLQERYRAQSAYTPEDILLTNLNIANQAAVQYGYSKNKRLLVELAILKMCYQRQAIEGSELESKKKRQSVAEAKEPVKKEPTREKPKQKTEQPAAEEPPKVEEPQPELEPEPQPETKAEPPKTEAQEPKALSEKEAKLDSDKKEEPETHAPKPKRSRQRGSSLLAGINIDQPENEAERAAPENPVWEPEAIHASWNKLIDEIKVLKEEALVGVLERYPLQQAKSKSLVVTVANKVEEDMLQQNRIRIAGMLAATFEVKQVDLTFEVDTSLQADTKGQKIYTAKEKYQHMLEKNELTETFRKRFDLDIDY